MARYFFHSRNGRVYSDPEGAELADSAAARVEGARYLAELLREGVEGFWRTKKLEVSVTDASGVLVGLLTITGIDGDSAP